MIYAKIWRIFHGMEYFVFSLERLCQAQADVTPVQAKKIKKTAESEFATYRI